jgi:hypothetical protein
MSVGNAAALARLQFITVFLLALEALTTQAICFFFVVAVTRERMHRSDGDSSMDGDRTFPGLATDGGYSLIYVSIHPQAPGAAARLSSVFA